MNRGFALGVLGLVLIDLGVTLVAPGVLRPFAVAMVCVLVFFPLHLQSL